MAKLALLGGKPVTKNLLGRNRLPRCKDLERSYLMDAWRSRLWDQNGEKSQVVQMEKDWAAFTGAKYALAVTNGTHTMQLALEALEIGPGDEVIVPGLTWQATASAAIDVNAVPVMVDVEPDTLCMDPKCVEAAITPRTRAIVPVHLYNRLANMDAIRKIARKHNLAIVEDCAHAHGSMWDGKCVGTLGDFGSFSMQNSKLVTGGEGGVIICNKKAHYDRLLSLRMCGRMTDAGVRIHQRQLPHGRVLGGGDSRPDRGAGAKRRRHA